MVAPLKLSNGYPLRWCHSLDDDRVLLVEWLDDSGVRRSFLRWHADDSLRRGGSFSALRLTDLPDVDTLDELASEMLRFGGVCSRLRYYDYRLTFAGCAFVTLAVAS